MTIPRSADPRFIRQWNEYVVFDALREAAAPMRVSDLAKATGLTAASLGQVLKGLESKGWVDSHGAEEQRRGRPAQVYMLREQPGSVLGIELGAHAARVVRMTVQGEVAARGETRFESDQPVGERVEDVRALLEDVLAEASAQPVWLSGVAASRRLGDALMEDDAVLEGMDQPAREVAAQVMPSPWIVYGDAQSATWAEHIEGAARGHDDVLLVHLGRRPTIGLLLAGQPRLGAHGAAGDLTWEALLPADRPGETEELHGLVAAALAGDEGATERAREYMRAAIPGLVLAAAVVDPEVLVLGRGFAGMADLAVDEMEEALAQGLQNPPSVVVSELDQFAVALGAAHLARAELVSAVVSPMRGVAELTAEARFADVVNF